MKNEDPYLTNQLPNEQCILVNSSKLNMSYNEKEFEENNISIFDKCNRQEKLMNTKALFETMNEN